MSNTAQTWTIIGGLAVVVGIIVGLQTFWIARSLDAIAGRLDRIDVRLDRIEDLLRGHEQRIARLEAR